MTMIMAIVTIAGSVYSSVVMAAKLEQEDHLHPGYAGPWPAM
jgi:hypothetical protein